MSKKSKSKPVAEPKPQPIGKADRTASKPEKIPDKKSEKLVLSRKLERLSVKVSALTEQIKKLDKPGALEHLAMIQKDALEMHRHLQLMIHKTIVCTEVSHFARHRFPTKVVGLHHALILAFDMPDEWWRERESRTVGMWIALLENEMKQHWKEILK